MNPHHKISGSEAFAPGPHVIVRHARRPRKPLHPAIPLLSATGAVGAVASILDMLIGAPLFLGLALIGFFFLWAWPSH